MIEDIELSLDSWIIVKKDGLVSNADGLSSQLSGKSIEHFKFSMLECKKHPDASFIKRSYGKDNGGPLEYYCLLCAKDYVLSNPELEELLRKNFFKPYFGAPITKYYLCRNCGFNEKGVRDEPIIINVSGKPRGLIINSCGASYDIAIGTKYYCNNCNKPVNTWMFK